MITDAIVEVCFFVARALHPPRERAQAATSLVPSSPDGIPSLTQLFPSHSSRIAMVPGKEAPSLDTSRRTTS